MAEHTFNNQLTSLIMLKEERKFCERNNIMFNGWDDGDSNLKCNSIFKSSYCCSEIIFNTENENYLTLIKSMFLNIIFKHRWQDFS